MTDDLKFQTPEGIRWLWRQHVARDAGRRRKRAINHNSRVGKPGSSGFVASFLAAASGRAVTRSTIIGLLAGILNPRSR